MEAPKGDTFDTNSLVYEEHEGIHNFPEEEDQMTDKWKHYFDLANAYMELLVIDSDVFFVVLDESTRMLTTSK